MYPGSCVWLVYRYLLQGLVVVDTAEVELMDLEEWFLVKVLLLLSWILLDTESRDSLCVIKLIQSHI